MSMQIKGIEPLICMLMSTTMSTKRAVYTNWDVLMMIVSLL